MRWFRRRRNELEPLEERLRSLRADASPAFLESVASRIRPRAPRPVPTRPALRYRAAFAVVLTAALVAAAAAEGGLGYASTATGRTASAISHVFSATPSRQNAALHPAIFDKANKGNDNDKGKGDQDGDNPAGHQYVKFVYVCVTIPGHHDGDHDRDDHRKLHVTLYLPKPAADHLIDEGIAKRGAC